MIDVTLETFYDPNITGISSPYISVRDKLRTGINALDAGLAGDDSTDNDSQFDNVLSDLNSWGGGKLILDGGAGRNAHIYRTSGIVDLPEKVTIEGIGDYLTEIKATHSGPVVRCNGAQGSVHNGAGLRNLKLRGNVTYSGDTPSNTSSIGLSSLWTNRANFENVRIFGCYYAVYTTHNWQSRYRNIHANGAGNDRCYNGFWADQASSAPYNDNAMICDNVMMQDIIHYAFRLKGFAGSKFSNCEGSGGTIGWYLWDSSVTGNEEFGSFINCIADTVSDRGWLIKKGANSSAARRIRMANCWAGNTGGNGFEIDGVEDATFSNLNIASADKHGILAKNGNNLSFMGGVINGFGSNSNQPGIGLENQSETQILGYNVHGNDGTGKSCVESSGSTHNNIAHNDFPDGGTALTGSLWESNRGIQF